MYPEPRYLDLEQELYPEITLYKEFIFRNQEDGFQCQFFERVAYDSCHRIIDVCDCIQQIITKNYSNQIDFQIYVFDPQISAYSLIGFFPSKGPITLGQSFLQAETIIIDLKQNSSKLVQDEGIIKNAGAQNDFDKNQISIVDSNSPEAKKMRKKTIKDLLTNVQQWRKLYFQSNFKMTVGEAAQIIGISRRILQSDIQIVKLGQKYNFQFEQNLNSKINELKKFVKEKTQLKKLSEMEMLQKLKNYYKE